MNVDRNAAAPVTAGAWEAYATAAAASSPPAGATPADPAAPWRQQIAVALGASPAEVHLCSGGTEANARALATQVAALAPHRRHLLVAAIDHAAVRNTLACLAQQDPGLEVEQVPAAADGRLCLRSLRQRLRPQTGLVAMCWACNETGVLQPLTAVAALCRAQGVALHTDAVQVAGRQRIDFAALQALGVGSLAISGHKVGAVGGIGAALWAPTLVDAYGLPDAARTNLPGCASLAAALTAAQRPQAWAAYAQLAARRDGFEAALQAALPGIEVLGVTAPRLANTSCLRVTGCEADGLLMALDLQGVAVSTGSACSSGSLEPSPILMGMGLSKEAARQTLRISLAPGEEVATIERLTALLIGEIERFRAL